MILLKVGSVHAASQKSSAQLAEQEQVCTLHVADEAIQSVKHR